MSRFGDSANGPSVLDISNISGVSADIDTLADHATAISNLGPVATEISNLGTTAVIADMSALGTQAVRDDMDALADVTTELGVLGNTTTAGYIAAIGTSTVGATSQLTVDALGQLTSEISLLASNITTLQNSASNSPIQIGNLSDVDFTSNSPSLGDTIVFTSNNKFEAQALPGAGPLSGTNLTVTNPQLNEILKISAVNAGIPEYVNTTVSALVYSADFDNLTEVAAATPAAAGEVVHYDGTSAWTVGQLDYSEITGTPSLHAVATSGASTDLSDTANLVYQSSGTINGDYVINGQKIWTSRVEHSDLMLLLARTQSKDEVEKRTDGLSVFIVDLREAVGNGMDIKPIRTMINHATTEVFFDDLVIPANSLVGEEGKGFKYILDGMNAERILIASECIGDGRFFIDRASAYAAEREVFGRPIGENQGIQFPIARAYVQLSAAAAVVDQAAAMFEAGEPCGTEANMAKMLASEASWYAADMCVQTHGGFGFAEEYDIERKFRETRLYQGHGRIQSLRALRRAGDTGAWTVRYGQTDQR